MYSTVSGFKYNIILKTDLAHFRSLEQNISITGLSGRLRYFQTFIY